MDAQVEDRDDPQELVHALRTILDKHLDSWEYGLVNENSNPKQTAKIVIQTANELVASKIQSEDKSKEIKSSVQTQDLSNHDTKPLICPKCNEVMTKKDGKDYYLCSKHWGYPDMIRAGQVREKRF